MANINTIHPSKRPRVTNQAESPMTQISQEVQIELNESSESSESSERSEYSPDQVLNKRKQNSSADIGKKISIKHKISARKAAGICQTISAKGCSISTPTHVAIWKATNRKASGIFNQIQDIIEKESFCLHFDGKKIGGTEYQVVGLKNTQREIRLAVASCKSSSANDIFKAISEVLTEYNGWHAIKMIVSDTCLLYTSPSPRD